MRLDPKILLVLVLPLALASTGCESSLLAMHVANDFTRQQSCPESRFQVKRVVFRPQELFERGSPPAEIVADPARLAVWQRNADNDFKRHADFTLVDLTGCGAHHTELCYAEYPGNDEFVANCDPVDLDHPELKFASYPMKPTAGQLLRQRLDARH